MFFILASVSWFFSADIDNFLSKILQSSGKFELSLSSLISSCIFSWF